MKPGQQPRDDPRKEHPAHRDLDRGGIDHHDDRGRNEDAQRTRVTDHASGEFLGIAHLPHPRDHDRPDGHHRRRGRPGKRREKHTGEDTGNRQPAGQMPDTGDGKADDPLRHAAGGHETGREDKERDGQQGEMPFERFEKRPRDRGQRAFGIRSAGRALRTGPSDTAIGTPISRRPITMPKRMTTSIRHLPLAWHVRTLQVRPSTSWLATRRSTSPRQICTATCAKPDNQQQHRQRQDDIRDHLGQLFVAFAVIDQVFEESKEADHRHVLHLVERLWLRAQLCRTRSGNQRPDVGGRSAKRQPSSHRRLSAASSENTRQQATEISAMIRAVAGRYHVDDRIHPQMRRVS